MTDDLNRAMQARIEQKTLEMDVERLHIYPYYGEVYAEVVQPGADPDFNFIFHWGPRLTPYERTLVHTLVYLARKQAGHDAVHSLLSGIQQRVPVEIYIEAVPERLLQQARAADQRPPLSLTQLTNISPAMIYKILKSGAIAAFVTHEPGRRIHLDGRVITSPARFFVRVDPVPTPEQAEEIRGRLAIRLVGEELGLTSTPERSLISIGEGSVTSTPERSVIPTGERSQPASLISTTETSDEQALISTTARSETEPLIFTGERSHSSVARSLPCGDESETLQKPTNRNVSETPETRPSGSEAETGRVLHNSLEEWRRTTEDLARHSAKELDDTNSLGYHIQVWNHARKHDRQRGTKVLTDGVFDILRELSQRRVATTPPQPQGKAWTRRTRKWFEDNGVPLSVKSEGTIFDEGEVAEVRAALANAPFMQTREE